MRRKEMKTSSFGRIALLTFTEMTVWGVGAELAVTGTALTNSLTQISTRH
jgi:hypothetical protein